MTSTNLRQPPRGLEAFFWRAPISFYRIGLGGLFGQRFLLLNHLGRKSGLPRQALLEVVHRDAENYYIVSGFGEKSQWFKNITHTPQVKFQVGRKKFETVVKRLSVAGASEILHHYAEEHPRSLQELAKLMGFDYEGSEENLQEMANLLPVFALNYQ